MEQTGVYLYCIARAAADSVTELHEIEGIDGRNHLYTVTVGDICGVVSQVPLSEFGAQVLDENLQNMQWLERKALLHENILEQVMNISVIVPMRFCTIYKNSERIGEVLAERYEQFSANLHFLKDKEEWGVKIYLDSQILAREIAKVSEKIHDLEKKVAATSSGKAFFLKKMLADLINKEVDTKSLIYADECYARLAMGAEESCLNKLLDKEVTGKAQEMILNSAYLLHREKVPWFKREIVSLEQAYGSLGMEFAVTGPWPAYHFCQLGLNGRDNNE